MKITYLLMALSLLTGCETKPRFDEKAVRPAQSLAPTTRLQVGEVVEIHILEGTNVTPIKAALDSEGWLDLPKVGKFYVLGTTTSEAETVLWKSCREQGIIPLGQPSREYYLEVMGEVKRPGRQPYLGRTTLARVIESAGGLTAAANRKRLIVHRADGATECYVYEQIRDKPTDDREIWPGDAVQVQKRTFIW